MLTATYTLVSLSVEQTRLRANLSSFQQHAATHFSQLSALKPQHVDYALEMLRRLLRGCRWRKLETSLVPAMRNGGERCAALLSELERYNRQAADTLAALEADLAEWAVDTPARVARLCEAIDSFCMILLVRLAREEAALFPLARSIVSDDAWFAIANEILSGAGEGREDEAQVPVWAAARARELRGAGALSLAQ